MTAPPRLQAGLQLRELRHEATDEALELIIGRELPDLHGVREKLAGKLHLEALVGVLQVAVRRVVALGLA